MMSLEDKLKLYLENSFKELSPKYRERIDIMVLDIERLFYKSDTFIKEDVPIYRFNQSLIYDSLSGNILNGDKVVRLNNQEIALLEYLIKNKGITISYEMLMSVISNCLNKNSSIDTLRTVVKRLRAKTDKSIIETFSKVGYRLL